MSTLASILRHERRAAMADRALAIALLVFVAAAIYALASGQRWADSRDADVNLSLQQAQQRSADFQADLRIYESGQGHTLERAPWYPGWIKSPTAVGARAGLPSLPLAALASNAGELQPALASLRVTTSRYGLFDDARASTQNPAMLSVGRFDGVFLLTAVLPLLLLAFSYNLLSAEREQGTLALVLVQPVKLTQIVLGKLLVRVLLILLPAIALVLGLLLADGVPADARAWVDYGLLALLIFGYGLFWLLLAALVNGYGRSSAANALSLGGIWLALVLVIPSLLNLLLLAVQPPPDRAALTNTLRSTLVEARNRSEDLFGDFSLQHPDVPIPSDPAGNDTFESSKAILKNWLVSQRLDALVAPVADAFEQRLDAQQQWAGRLRFLSPALCFQDGLTRLAGVDHARSDQFRDAVRAYLALFRAALVPKIEAGASMKSTDFDRLPSFAMPLPARADALFADGLGIVLPTLLLAVFTVIGLRRYRLGK
ncbi:MAG: ABC transporter permease subunit [Panacagrimonas sp.]